MSVLLHWLFCCLDLFFVARSSRGIVGRAYFPYLKSSDPLPSQLSASSIGQLWGHELGICPLRETGVVDAMVRKSQASTLFEKPVASVLVLLDGLNGEDDIHAFLARGQSVELTSDCTNSLCIATSVLTRSNRTSHRVHGPFFAGNKGKNKEKNKEDKVVVSFSTPDSGFPKVVGLMELLKLQAQKSHRNGPKRICVTQDRQLWSLGSCEGKIPSSGGLHNNSSSRIIADKTLLAKAQSFLSHAGTIKFTTRSSDDDFENNPILSLSFDQHQEILDSKGRCGRILLGDLSALEDIDEISLHNREDANAASLALFLAPTLAVRCAREDYGAESIERRAFAMFAIEAVATLLEKLYKKTGTNLWAAVLHVKGRGDDILVQTVLDLKPVIAVTFSKRALQLQEDQELDDGTISEKQRVDENSRSKHSPRATSVLYQITLWTSVFLLVTATSIVWMTVSMNNERDPLLYQKISAPPMVPVGGRR